MEPSILKVVGQVAGIGGLALGVLLLIFRDVIRKNIFPTLTKEQAYNLIRLIVVLAFVIAVLGVLAWVYTSGPMDKTSLKVEPGKEPLQVQLVPPSSEIPMEPMEPITIISGRGDALEITSVFYDESRQMLDVKVRNNSQESTVIEKIKLHLSYVRPNYSNLPPSGVHDARVKKRDIKAAKEAKFPLAYNKAYQVSYIIPPKGADRYLFQINLKKDDLYFPGSGEYMLLMNFLYNKGEVAARAIRQHEFLKAQPSP